MSAAYYNEVNAHAAGWLRNLVAAGLICAGDVDDRDIRDVCADDLKGYTQHHFFAGIGIWSLALRMAWMARRSPRHHRILPMPAFQRRRQRRWVC